MNPINVPDPEEQKEYPPLPVIPGGEYQARLAKVSEKPGYNPNDGPQWLWEFRLFTPWADHPMWLWTSQKLGQFTENGVVKKSKARLALEALLGRELMPKELLNWDDLIGLSCVLMVSREPRKDATPETMKDGTGWRNKITAVVPLEGVSDIPRQQSMYTQAVEVPTTSADLDLQKRYESALFFLKYGLPQLKEVIAAVASSNKPFFELGVDQKRMVVDYLEMELQKPENDVPFEGPDELDEAGLVAAGSATEPVRSIGQRQIPASTKHKVG